MTHATIDTATAKISELKEFAKVQGFTPIGNKNFKSVWIAAVDFYLESKIVLEIVNSEAIETYQESETASEVVAVEVEKIVIEIFKVLTSPTAIDIYKKILRYILLAVVLICFAIGKLTLWTWNHRNKTAVYHWVKQFNDSKMGYQVRCESLVLVLGFTVKFDNMKVEIVKIIESILSRLGLSVSPMLIDLETL